MSDKACFRCQHYCRQRTGPHEWSADCALRQRDFPDAAHCAFYQPAPEDPIDEGERWPSRNGREVTTWRS